MKMVLTGLKTLEVISDSTLAEPAFDADQILVDVLCCAVCRTDAKMWDQGHRDLIFPRVLGHEFVVQDTSGNRYVVWPGKSCGQCKFCSQGRENLCEHMKITGFHNDGGFADQAVLPADSLVPIPGDLDRHAACYAEPVACVVNAFEKLNHAPGSRILIYGAGTMGLITALYALKLGLSVQILEKNQSKIDRVANFLSAYNLSCSKDIPESEYEMVINCCADYIAFCQAITKVDKAGQICFFSGITKNEQIETNLINLLHYKEACMTGVYGMTKAHMEEAVPFIQTHAEALKALIQDIVPPQQAPGLMNNVLSGQDLKYILDFDLSHPADTVEKTVQQNPSAADTAKILTAPPTLEDLYGQTLEAIKPLPGNLKAKATAKMDDKTKPLGALGRLEPLAIQMSLIQDTLTPQIRQKHLFVFAGDHGVTEEGVSAYPSEVTGQMVENFLNGGAAINVLCRHHHIGMNVVDMGVKSDFTLHPDLLMKKVARGTKNFAIEPAMTRKQAIAALENGMSVFFDTHDKTPVDIVGLGEMGIGNTTSAAAIICAVTQITPEQATGRGTGVDDKGLEHKTKVIKKVLDFHTLDPEDGLDILEKIGGFEIAGIAGAVLAAASRKTAVVLDGVISTAAGLVAFLINPGVKPFLIAGHKSVEISQKAALDHMGLDPLIDFNMRLGEGTGAALAMDMADAACKIMCEMASFDEAKIARSTLKS